MWSSASVHRYGRCSRAACLLNRNMFRFVCWSCHWYWLPRRELLFRQLTKSLHRLVVPACCCCLTCLTCQVPLRSSVANLLHSPCACSRPSALMTVFACCLATLHMLPRPANAIHLYSWIWHAGFVYIHAFMHTCIHAYMHTCIHAYMHTCKHAYIHAYIHTYRHT